MTNLITRRDPPSAQIFEDIFKEGLKRSKNQEEKSKQECQSGLQLLHRLKKQTVLHQLQASKPEPHKKFSGRH
jgi:hypothetical protein